MAMTEQELELFAKLVEAIDKTTKVLVKITERVITLEAQMKDIVTYLGGTMNE